MKITDHYPTCTCPDCEDKKQSWLELEAENARLKEINVQFEFALKLLIEELNALKEEEE